MNDRKLKLAGLTMPFFTLPGGRLLIAALILILMTALSASMQKTSTSISLFEQAHAQETNVEPASVSPAAGQWRDCQIADVVARLERIHVRCTTAEPAGIFYFAAPTRDSSNANRLLSVLLTAYATNGKIAVLYETLPDPSYGCAAVDCRPLYVVAAIR